jgi:hypothetical protein
LSILLSIRFLWILYKGRTPQAAVKLASLTYLKPLSDGNIFGMDIKAQTHYFFFYLPMWCVGCSLLRSSDSGSSPLPERADRLLTKQPAIPMQPAHHAFFNQPCCAADLLTQVGPQP